MKYNSDTKNESKELPLDSDESEEFNRSPTFKNKINPVPNQKGVSRSNTKTGTSERQNSLRKQGT